MSAGRDDLLVHERIVKLENLTAREAVLVPEGCRPRRQQGVDEKSKPPQAPHCAHVRGPKVRDWPVRRTSREAMG